MNGPATPEVTFDVTNTRLLNVSGTQTNSAAAANFTSDSLVMTFGTTNPVSITKGSNKLTLASGDSLDTTSADSLKQAGVIVPATIYWNFRLDPNATVTEYDLAIAKRAFKVVSIDVVPSTLQGGALTATIVKSTGTAAPANGTTPLHTANSINLNTGAYTVQSITLTSTTADLVFAAGDRLGIDYSAAYTAGHAVVTIGIQYQ